MTTGNLSIQDNQTLIQYTSVGESSFAFPFPILETDELKVSRNQVLLTFGTDYSITGLGADGGGTITLLTGASTPGQVFTLWQDMPIERLTGFSAGAAVILGTALNAEFAARLRVEQQLRREIRNSLRLPPDDLLGSQDMVLQNNATRGGKYLAFDAVGRPIPAIGTGNDSALRSDLASVVSAADGARLSGFRRQATGATPRTVYDKLIEVVSVKDFGAVADGATNNTAAIQAAVTAAGIGGRVVFPGTGIYRCTGSLTVPAFQTWYGDSYSPGSGGPPAALECTKINGTFITAGSSFKIEGLQIYGAASYTDASGAVTVSTAIAIALADNITLRDVIFKAQFICIQAPNSVYIRVFGGEVVRCGTFINMVTQDLFNLQIDGTIFRLCSAVTSSNDSPKRFVHNLKVMGCSFESWVGLFNCVRTASFFGSYFESDIIGGFGFNSDGAFTSDTSISLFGCLIFVNNLNRFINYSGLGNVTFVSIGNVIAGSINSGQNQYYFVPQNAGSGRTVMIGDFLDDRGHGVFEGSYVSAPNNLLNQLIVWPRGSTTDHANSGQTWVDGSVLLQTATTAQLTAIANAINTSKKFDGKMVRNTTSNKVVIAQGAAAGSTWISVDGATTHVPV